MTRPDPRRVPASALLTCYLVLLFVVPAGLVFAPLGAAGTPATVFGIVLLLWWVSATLAGQRPDVLRWAARSLAVAAAAGAQVVVITFVLGRVYRMRPFHETVRLAAALICCTAAVSAAALGLASQG